MPTWLYIGAGNSPILSTMLFLHKPMSIFHSVFTSFLVLSDALHHLTSIIHDLCERSSQMYDIYVM